MELPAAAAHTKQRRGSREILGIDNVEPTGLFHEWYEEVQQGSWTVTAFDEDLDGLEGAKALIPLRSTQSLRELTFSGCSMEDRGIEALGEALAASAFEAASC